MCNFAKTLLIYEGMYTPVFVHCKNNHVWQKTMYKLLKDVYVVDVEFHPNSNFLS